MGNRNILRRYLAALLCIALAAAMVGCTPAPAGGSTPTVMEDGAVYGEGAAEFTFTVVDKDGVCVTATIRTDKQTVGEALQELGLLEGEEGPYGLYIKTVNGQTLDYAADGMYWSFYVDGEYAMTGVDMTDIVPGSTYTIRAEKG